MLGVNFSVQWSNMLVKPELNDHNYSSYKHPVANIKGAV